MRLPMTLIAALMLGSAAADLFVNAPDVRSAGRSRTFTTNAGDAMLVLETRESHTNALRGRVIDRRETRGMQGQGNRVTNTAEFRTLARNRARISTGKLDACKAVSPIPEPLTPGQRLKQCGQAEGGDVM